MENGEANGFYTEAQKNAKKPLRLGVSALALTKFGIFVSVHAQRPLTTR